MVVSSGTRCCCSRLLIGRQSDAADLQEARIKRENHENWDSVSDPGVRRSSRVLNLVCCGWVCDLGKLRDEEKIDFQNPTPLAAAEIGSLLAAFVGDYPVKRLLAGRSACLAHGKAD